MRIKVLILLVILIFNVKSYAEEKSGDTMKALKAITELSNSFSIYQYELLRDEAKTSEGSKLIFNSYFRGIIDGMQWTDSICLGDKFVPYDFFISSTNSYIEFRNFTLEEKKTYPIGLIIANLFKEGFPCKK